MRNATLISESMYFKKGLYFQLRMELCYLKPTDALPLFGNILASGQWPFWSFLGNRICFHTFAVCVSIRFKISLPLFHGSLPTAKQTLQQSAKHDIHHLQPVAEVLHQLDGYLLTTNPHPKFSLTLSHLFVGQIMI